MYVMGSQWAAIPQDDKNQRIISLNIYKCLWSVLRQPSFSHFLHHFPCCTNVNKRENC